MAKILVTGSTGLVGTALVAALRPQGRIVRLVRGSPAAGDRSGDASGDPYGHAVRWDPRAGTIDAGGLEGLDAVVHLAGENIAGGRWNEERKRHIRDSRVEGTALLARTLAGLESKPGVLVCASAVGFYGDRGEERLDEQSAPGEGFLPEVCVQWEAAADPAREAGIRVVHLRIGIVLSPDGGALKKMLLPFRLGLGGPLGNGRQFMSWISLPDLVGVIRLALEREDLAGPVNAVAPESVRNREFTKALGRALRRPTVLPAPAFALRLLLGREMADALLLASTRVLPARLQSAGYIHQHPDLDGAFAALL